MTWIPSPDTMARIEVILGTSLPKRRASTRKPQGKALTLEQVREIRMALSSGEKGIILADRYHVSGGTISSIKHYKIWQEIEEK